MPDAAAAAGAATESRSVLVRQCIATVSESPVRHSTCPMSRSEKFRCRGLTGRCRNVSLLSENVTRVETPLFGTLNFCDTCCVELGIAPRPGITLELDQETPGAPASDVDANLSQWIAKFETADLNAKQFTNSVRISVIKNFNRALLSSMALCFRMRKSALNQRVFGIFLKWINQLLSIPPSSDLTPVKLNHLPLLISVICVIFETPNEFASMQPPPLPMWTLNDFPPELIDSIGKCFLLQTKEEESDWIESKGRWAAVRATLPIRSVSLSNTSTTTLASTATSATSKNSVNKSTTSKSKLSVSESSPLTPRASATPGNNDSVVRSTNSSETTTTTSSNSVASPKHLIPSPMHEIASEPSLPSAPILLNSTSTSSASTTTTSTNPDSFDQLQFTTRAPIPTVAPNPRRRIVPAAPPAYSNHNSGSNSMYQVLSRITRLEAENSRLHQEVQRSRSRSRHRSLSRSRGVSHGNNRSRSPPWRNQNQSRQHSSASGFQQHHQRNRHNQMQSHPNRSRSHPKQAHSRADNHNRAHREVEVQKYAHATEYANFSPPQY